MILTTDWESLGCEIVGEAENGQQAYELVQKLSPDLILTDIRMPLLNGLEFIRKIKSICSAEVLIISGYNDFDYAKQALQLGVADFITKPIDDDELYDSISRTVKKIQQKKQLYEPDINNSVDSQFIQFMQKSFFSQNHYITKALTYIEGHYSSNISIKDVCKSLLISESYLTKIFKENTSYSFVDYLTNYRMKKACELLKDPSLRIYLVASSVGYKDQRYFSALFKKTVGITPKQFRILQLSNNFN